MTYRNLSAPEYEVVVDKDVRATMRDGTVLRARVHRPKTEGRFPVLVERTPYNKDNSAEISMGSPEFFASRGYVVVIQDVRGRFASEGDYYPFRDDGWGANRDGYDTVEWAASQPWSNGDVGTFGGSYSGATQYLIAPTRPPHLKAMFVREAFSDRHSHAVFRGGALKLTGFIWPIDSILSDIQRLAKPEDVERYKSLLQQVHNERDNWYWRLPVAPWPFLEGLADWYNDWLDHPDDGPYWWPVNIETQRAEIDTPICHFGGLYDHLLEGTLNSFTGIKRLARSEKARQGQKLILGPWVHGPTAMGESKAGEYDCGPTAVVDFNELRLSWFDYWLKGIDTGVMDEPPVRVFVMGTNEWRTASDWPLPETKYTPIYLHAGKSGTIHSLNDGTLSFEGQGDGESPDSFLYDPYDPVLSIGGNTNGAQTPPGVYDQREVEQRCLTYTTEPLTHQLTAIGPIKAVLYGLSSAPDTDWVVRLSDVHPDGYSRPLADGIIRARYRDSFREPTLLTPGTVYKYQVDMWAIGNAFLPGHRIRVTVTSSCFPRYDRNMNTGASNNAREAVGQSAINTVFHDGMRPSHILLPLIDA